MARSDPERAAATDPDQDFGVVLGWEAEPAGGKLVLCLQSARQVPGCRDDVRRFKYFLTREQAVQLGHYLYACAGETAPSRKRRGLIERLLG